MKGNKTGERERERKKKERARLGSTVTVGWFESMIRCRPQSQLRLPIALIRYIWFSDINHQLSLLYFIYFSFPIIFFAYPDAHSWFGKWMKRDAPPLSRKYLARWSVIVLSEFFFVWGGHNIKAMKMKNGLACFVFISDEDPTREFTAESNNKLKPEKMSS